MNFLKKIYIQWDYPFTHISNGYKHEYKIWYTLDMKIGWTLKLVSDVSANNQINLIFYLDQINLECLKNKSN